MSFRITLSGMEWGEAREENARSSRWSGGKFSVAFGENPDCGSFEGGSESPSNTIEGLRKKVDVHALSTSSFVGVEGAKKP